MNHLLQISAGRAGKFVKLDMRIGYIVSYPNGSLQFETKRVGQLDDASPYQFGAADSRF